jgi:hypothetical protein
VDSFAHEPPRHWNNLRTGAQAMATFVIVHGAYRVPL